MLKIFKTNSQSVSLFITILDFIVCSLSSSEGMWFSRVRLFGLQNPQCFGIFKCALHRCHRDQVTQRMTLWVGGWMDAHGRGTTHLVFPCKSTRNGALKGKCRVIFRLGARTNMVGGPLPMGANAPTHPRGHTWDHTGHLY